MKAVCHPDQPHCAEGLCRACYNKAWRAKRNGYHRDYLRQRKLELLALRGGQCVDCGYNRHPAALDFDHVIGSKEFSIALGLGKPWDVLVTEAKKCVIRCANCRRERMQHYQDKEVAFYKVYRKERRATFVCLYCAMPQEGKVGQKYCDDRCGNAYRQAQWRARHQAASGSSSARPSAL